MVETFGSDGKMSFRVGRKGSDDTATWFNDRVDADQTTFDHASDKLNFAFIGKLELTLSGDFDESKEMTFTFLNVAIAQGSSGTSNNWWFGGTSCSYIGNNEVACTGKNSNGADVTFNFKRGGNPVNVVSLMASNMTYHDNKASILLSSSSKYTLVGGSYTVESYCVTDGQDPLGNIYDGLVKAFGSDGEMSFRVGRKGSDDAAKWFNDRVDAVQTTFDHAADKLNFAFIGTLKLTLTGGIFSQRTETFTFLNVAIAQGHAGTSNNWWFGGTSCSYIGNNEVACTGTYPNGVEVLFEFLRGGNTVNEIEASLEKLVDTANWMGELEDSVNLNEIMMPGSHDAGMSELHHCAPPIGAKANTQTQSESIGVQLLDGSRYFDIRVDYDHDELVTYHRSEKFGVDWGCNGQDLESVLDQTTDFLSEHTKETVFLKFSHIRNDSGHDAQSTKEKINDFLNDYSTYIYTNASESINLCDVSLSSVRGKMILVFDYDDFIDPATGRFRYKDGSSRKSGSNLTVYDDYSDTDDYETMKEDQLDKWEEYGGLGKGHLFLLSWTLTSVPGKASVETLAEKANSNLPEVLYDQIVTKSISKPNIVYIDYMNSFIAQSIIQYNF